MEEPLLSLAEQSDTGAGRLLGGQLRSPPTGVWGRCGSPKAATTPPTPSKSVNRAPYGRGQRGPAGVWWKRPGGVSPLRRQWIEVETEHGTAYQAHLVVAEQPAAVVWPQSAWLAQLDQFPFGVDFVVDLHIVPAEKAKPQVRRKKRELVDQADQYGAETSGLPDTLHEAASDLGELGVRLGRTASEVEVQSVTALTVWGATPAECEERARTLQGALSGVTTSWCGRSAARRRCWPWGCPGCRRRRRCGSSASTSSRRTGRCPVPAPAWRSVTDRARCWG
ncbi:hypothetical protein ACFQZC_00025 [Streptacidiphilus monticola]